MSVESLEARRLRRRQETSREIEAHALAVMAVDGVGGLTVASIARRMGIKPPSVYKHVESLEAVYDALFRRGQLENLEAVEQAVASADRGIPAVGAALEATARWAFANPVLAQLLFWRPVPRYEPSGEALEPGRRIESILRRELAWAVQHGELTRAAVSAEGMTLLSAMHFGVISQHLANEPQTDWAHSRFARVHRRVMELFVQAYPPA